MSQHRISVLRALSLLECTPWVGSPVLANNEDHGAAVIDIDFKIDLPPPLPCMRWFAIH
ncbi:MAG: hypothetical protein KDB27_12645 [Planctomycetales bacterium]|nr:hypothetical protein [Planctomycetales bacterium]